MSALGFLGGLGGFAGSFQQGYEKSEDRETARKEQEFINSQRQRKIEEQKRADEARIADANVATTEQFETPATQTIYGEQAPVVRDDEGNLMPGAVETPAKTETRKRPWDAILRDYAANRRKAGDVAGAVDFETKAAKVATDLASREASSLIGQSGSMSLEQYAKAASQVFTKDGSPFVISGDPVVNKDGTVTLNVTNTTNNRTLPATFKDKSHLTTALRSMFQPDVQAKLLEKQAEIEAEIAKNPFHNVTAGAIALDKRTSKPVAQNEIGYIEDANGNLIKGGKGTTAKSGKVTDPLDAVADSVVETIDKSDAKGALKPEQLARAKTLGRQLVFEASRDGKNIDRDAAGEIAIGVATGKVPVVPAFNPRTGTIDNIVEYQGSNFAIESLGKPGSARLDDKQLSSVATNYISKLPADQRAQMVAAAYNPEALRNLNASFEQRARAPEAIAALEQRLGRKPTEDDISKAVKATQDALRPGLEMISRYATLSDEGKKLTISIAKEAGYTSDFKSKAPAATNKKIVQPAGMRQASAQDASMEARFAQEDSELVRGTRTDYSPEVRKYYEEKQRTKREQKQQSEKDYLESERQRALQASKGLMSTYR